MQDILVPISPGELLDKITILRIKSERMEDVAKLANVRLELSLLEKTWRESVSGDVAAEEREDERGAGERSGHNPQWKGGQACGRDTVYGGVGGRCTEEEAA